MILKNGATKGFTLVELLVVIAMIAVIMGAMTVSVNAARERARISKATAEVKAISQAILSYENLSSGYRLDTMEERDADSSAIGFLIGKGGSTETGNQMPAVLMASLAAGDKLRDPWGRPYKITIRGASVNFTFGSANGNMQTGYFYPNYNALSKEERE